jgi:PAS domain S-box-containing protein
MTTVRWQKNEDALRRLIDGMAALVTAHSPEGELEFANRQLLDYVGKTVDQLKDWRTNGEIHPDDLDTVDAMWTDCMQTGRPYEHVNRYRCADGEYHWFHAGGRPERDEQGRIVRWYVVLTDIEEARVSERDRIARDLHDTLLQSTEGLILKVHVAMQRLSPGDPLRLFLARSVEQAERLAVEGRQKLLGLTRQPFARPELSQAFAVLGKELSAGTATRFRAVRRGRVRTVATTTWDEVFSIAREGITNAFKHAHADHIDAFVIYGPTALRVWIRDDGKGVPGKMGLVSKPGHCGLRIMRERARRIHAELAFESGSDQGTTISFAVPESVAYLRHPTSKL